MFRTTKEYKGALVKQRIHNNRSIRSRRSSNSIRLTERGNPFEGCEPNPPSKVLDFFRVFEMRFKREQRRGDERKGKERKRKEKKRRYKMRDRFVFDE